MLQIETQNCILEVRRFVTRVWNHPLLNEQTNAQRVQALTATETFMERKGLSKEEYIALLVGGLVWIVGPSSDYDVSIVTKKSKAYQSSSFLWALLEKDREPTVSKVDVTNVVGSDEIMQRKESLLSLFVTPDKYIAGNIGFARQLRCRVIEDLTKAEPNLLWAIWEGPYSVLNNRFKQYYKLWYQRTKDDGSSSRQKRFFSALETRASLYSSPATWKEKILARLESDMGFVVPDFIVYQQAIPALGGRLELLHN